MAIAFDSAGTSFTTSSDGVFSCTQTITDNTNGILVAFVGIRTTTAAVNSAPKYAGNNMTKVIAGSAANVNQELWYLVNPPTGLGTLNGTWSATSTRKPCVMMAFTGVNTSVPFAGSNFFAGTAASGSIANVGLGAGNWEIGAFVQTAQNGTMDIGNVRGSVGDAFMQELAGDSTGGTLRWTLPSTVFTLVGAELAVDSGVAPQSNVGYRSLLGVGV